MLVRLRAAAHLNRRELASLRAKIADLEVSLAEAMQKQKQVEAQRTELADGGVKVEQRREVNRVVSAKERAERAHGKAGRARNEYEGLRRVLEGALEK